MFLNVLFGFGLSVVTFVITGLIMCLFKIPHAEKIDIVRLIPVVISFVLMLFFTWAVKDPTWMWAYIATSNIPLTIWWCRKVAPKNFL